MMREIRDELSKKYNHDPSFSENSLKRIKKKYTARLEMKKRQKEEPMTQPGKMQILRH